MTYLTKKSIQVDANLASVLGVQEGALVSYAEVTKGVHDYIKKMKLRVEKEAPKPSAAPQPIEAPPGPPLLVACIFCGAEIPSGSTFCDRCGKQQS